MFLDPIPNDCIKESTNVIYKSFPPTNIRKSIYDLNLTKKGLLCWWCCHNFESNPCYLPMYKNNENVIFCKGYFCSFNCALSYSRRKNEGNVYLLHSLYRLLFNKNKFDRIKEAYPRETLKSFGGILDIIEYRKGFESLSEDWIFTEYPIIHQIAQIKKSKIKEIKESFQTFDLDKIVEKKKKEKIPKKQVVKKSKLASLFI